MNEMDVDQWPQAWTMGQCVVFSGVSGLRLVAQSRHFNTLVCGSPEYLMQRDERRGQSG